ncbi:MAG: hypothetical protein ABEH80_10640 [Halobaculum sp.]
MSDTATTDDAEHSDTTDGVEHSDTTDGVEHSDTTDGTEHGSTANETEHSGTADSDTSEDDSDDSLLNERFRRWVNYLLLAGLSLVALVSGIRVYTAVDTLIRRFVNPEFQPLFQGAFNLALLLLAVAGVTYQLRRMR